MVVLIFSMISHLKEMILHDAIFLNNLSNIISHASNFSKFSCKRRGQILGTSANEWIKRAFCKSINTEVQKKVQDSFLENMYLICVTLLLFSQDQFQIQIQQQNRHNFINVFYIFMTFEINFCKWIRSWCFLKNFSIFWQIFLTDIS